MHRVYRWDILHLTCTDVSVQVMAVHSVGCHQVPNFFRAPSIVLHRVDIEGISLPLIRSLCDSTIKLPEHCNISSLQTESTALSSNSQHASVSFSGRPQVSGRTPSARVRKATKRLTADTPTAASVCDTSTAHDAGHKVEQKSLAVRVSCPSTYSNRNGRPNSGKCDSDVRVHKSTEIVNEPVQDQKSSDEPMLTPAAALCGEGNSTVASSSPRQLSAVTKVKKGFKKPGAHRSVKVVRDRNKSDTRTSRSGQKRVTSVHFLDRSDDANTLKEGSRKRKRDGMAGKSPAGKRRKLNSSADEVYILYLRNYANCNNQQITTIRTLHTVPLTMYCIRNLSMFVRVYTFAFSLVVSS